ncbi:MAG: phosphoglycerate kinase [Clostridiales bacterium]|nr:phosphoglycerate kinase [Clostridiales bacterium]
MKRTIKDLVGLRGKTVLLRTDFNVPIDENGRIMDITRIASSLPTIKYLIKQKAKVVILSHLGRPKGYDVHKSLWPVAMFLKGELRCGVGFCHSLSFDEIKYRVSLVREGSVLLLENTRFFEGEESCDMTLSKKLASLGDIYVNDAFGTAHRRNASTFGVARILPNAIGLLMEKELKAISPIVDEPKRPFVAVIGGAKVSSKLKVLKSIIKKADSLIIGGAMAYTFLKAQGESIGESLVEEDMVDDCLEILEIAKSLGKKVLLPIDHIVADASTKKPSVKEVKTIKENMTGYDIGAETIKMFAKEISKAKQIFWNGPMGKYEEARFSEGTCEVGNAIANCKGFTVVGGGDTLAAVNQFELGDGIDFMSTGGGATMEFIEQGRLPCIEVIQEKII